MYKNFILQSNKIYIYKYVYYVALKINDKSFLFRILYLLTYQSNQKEK